LEIIPNPESVSNIFMNKIAEVGDDEYLVAEKNIIKVVEKNNNR
jgi:hypothetical protein